MCIHQKTELQMEQKLIELKERQEVYCICVTEFSEEDNRKKKKQVKISRDRRIFS